MYCRWMTLHYVFFFKAGFLNIEDVAQRVSYRYSVTWNDALPSSGKNNKTLHCKVTCVPAHHNVLMWIVPSGFWASSYCLCVCFLCVQNLKICELCYLSVLIWPWANRVSSTDYMFGYLDLGIKLETRHSNINKAGSPTQTGLNVSPSPSLKLDDQYRVWYLDGLFNSFQICKYSCSHIHTCSSSCLPCTHMGLWRHVFWCMRVSLLCIWSLCMFRLLCWLRLLSNRTQ